MLLSRRAILEAALGAAAPAPTPVLYVTHGAPIFALPDPSARVAELGAWGKRLAKPRGVVVMTPHFAGRALALGPTGRGFAMYDLPPAIKRRIPPDLEYATPPSEAIAARIEAILGGALPRPERRGFDHTTWMPLKCLFPSADVPVVELTYPYLRDAQLFAFGQKLAPLRDDGILFVGSGGMVHNLAALDLEADAIQAPPWSREFDAWAAEALSASNVDALVDWRNKAPGQRIAHPDDGAHYRVLLVALGVATGGGRSARASFPIVGFEASLSKRSVELA